MNPEYIKKVWRSYGLPEAIAEYRFHPQRKWRFDFAFPKFKQKDFECSVKATPELMGGVAVEVQGGIFGMGKRCPVCKQTKAVGHTRGAALRREHEKRNAAAAMGWRILYCEPKGVCSTEFIQQLAEALKMNK